VKHNIGVEKGLCGESRQWEQQMGPHGECLVNGSKRDCACCFGIRLLMCPYTPTLLLFTFLLSKPTYFRCLYVQCFAIITLHFIIFIHTSSQCSIEHI